MVRYRKQALFASAVNISGKVSIYVTPVTKAQTSDTGASLTLHGENDRRGCRVTFYVAGLAGVAASVTPRHLLHHQTSVGKQNSVLPFLSHFHTL